MHPTKTAFFSYLIFTVKPALAISKENSPVKVKTHLSQHRNEVPIEEEKG